MELFDSLYKIPQGIAPSFRDSKLAFKNALDEGVFHQKLWNRDSYNFVGNWMYMHSQTTASGKLTDSFKHRDTRKYLTVEVR